MTNDARKRLEEAGATTPTFLWLFLFFLLPTLILVFISFRAADPRGGIGDEWTAAAYGELINPIYRTILIRTLRLSLLTTVICLLAGIPVGYCIARAPGRSRGNLLLLVIIPFWTSFLIRIFAWKVLLHPEGPIKMALLALKLVSENAMLMYNEGAVLLVLVYTYLPFAILPIFSAAEKYDFTLTEAARDLGASSLQAFFRVFLPGISQGIASAVLVVFVPALGSYVIPDIMGGTSGEMLGNKIAQRVFTDRNLPQASMLSTVLVLAVCAPLIVQAVSAARRPQRAVAEPGEAAR